MRAFNVTRQVVPCDFEVIHDRSAIIFHYRIQVDVLDANMQPVGSRAKHSQVQITLRGADAIQDASAVADAICTRYGIPDSKRPQLLLAINELRGKPASTRSVTPNVDKESARQVTRTAPATSARNDNSGMSREQVEDLLRDALEKIHWGQEKECYETLQTLAEIAELDRNLVLIIQHDPLMNTLINGLKKFAASSLAACTKILVIFERMSYFQHFMERLAKFKIGSMCLSLLHAQVALANVAVQNFDKEKLSAYMKLQNQLLKLDVSMLFNLSENPSTMRKMVNKDIIGALIPLLERRNSDLLCLILKFLRKIAMVPVNWSDVPYETILPSVIKNVFRWSQMPHDGDGRSKHVAVLKEGVELLYTFACHAETMEEFKNANAFEEVTKLAEIPELRGPLMRVYYKCATSGAPVGAFGKSSLLDMLIASATSDCEERMIALVILMNLSTDRECASRIAKSSVFTSTNLKNIFVQATATEKEENGVLLKMIRNVADNQPELIKGFDEEIVKACAQNRNNEECLCDVFAVANRAKMNSDRAKFFAGKDAFIAQIIEILKDTTALSQLHLEVVMFVSAIVLYSVPAQVLEKNRIVDHIVQLFLLHKNEPDIQAQCLFTFYRFICHTNTRNSLIAHSEIVDAVIQHSAARNAVLNQIGNAVLDALVTFEKSYAEKIKAPRFNAFNQDWLQSMAADQK